MTVFCVKCRRKVPVEQILNQDIVQNGSRFRLVGNCPICPGNTRVNRFVSRRDVEAGKQGSGILGDLLGKIPVVGPVLGPVIKALL